MCKDGQFAGTYSLAKKLNVIGISLKGPREACGTHASFRLIIHCGVTHA